MKTVLVTDLSEALELFFETVDETEVTRRRHDEAFVTRVEAPTIAFTTQQRWEA